MRAALEASAACTLRASTPTRQTTMMVVPDAAISQLAEARMDTIIDLERADSNIEVTRVKSADADVRIVRASNYVKVVEEALRRTPGNSDLEDELAKARDEVQAAVREKEEAEAEHKLAEAQQHHAFFLKDQFEDRQERSTFRKISFWQHMATYLLYFVMLMNVFITTFGISLTTDIS
jgi:hypothetical protein